MVNFVFLSVYFYSVPNLRFTNNQLKDFKIVDICKLKQGNQYDLKQQFTEEKSDLKRFIRIVDYTQKTNDIRYVYSNGSENYVDCTDVVVVRYGASAGYVGRGINGIIANNLFTIRPINSALLNKSYLYHYLNAPVIQKQLNNTQSSGMPALNFQTINNLHILLPEYQEQRQIAVFLDKIDERIQTQIKIIDDYNSLKMGIYNCMFKENYADYKLKQLAYIVKGDQINNDQLLSNGSYYMMNGGASPSGYLDSYNVSENTISISEGGNSCGYVQFNSSPFWSGGHCYTIQNVNSALIENKYLYHYLKYKEKEIMNLRIGTGLPNIQKKDLENFTILVPSLLIQRKTLALFEMLDEKISILNEELANLQKQKKYLLCNMFI